MCCACPTPENIRATYEALYVDEAAGAGAVLDDIREAAGHVDVDDCTCAVCDYEAGTCDTCEDNPCVCEATT